MLKAFKFRLYPNKEQTILINKHLGSNRFIYNYFLAKRIDIYKDTQKSLTYNQCANSRYKIGLLQMSISIQTYKKCFVQ